MITPSLGCKEIVDKTLTLPNPVADGDKWAGPGVHGGVHRAGIRDQKHQHEEAVAADHAYMESRIPDFTQAVERCLSLMRGHGNPGLERFKLQTFEGRSIIRPSGWPAKQGWRFGHPHVTWTGSTVLHVLTPSGQIASVHTIGWVSAAHFIRSQIAEHERSHLETWLEINKRRTVNILGTPPPSIGAGVAWRASVNKVVAETAGYLGALLHRHGIDIPQGHVPPRPAPQAPNPAATSLGTATSAACSFTPG